jgi:hypothetical protein
MTETRKEPLRAAEFQDMRGLPLNPDLRGRGFTVGMVAMAMRDPATDGWYQAPSLSIHHPRVAGLCVASPCIGWYSVTHAPTGRSIGTGRTTDHIREVVTMLRFEVLARHCGFSFAGMDAAAMGAAIGLHRAEPLPFTVEGCDTIKDFWEASRGATYLLPDGLMPSAMGDVDTLLDLLYTGASGSEP